MNGVHLRKYGAATTVNVELFEVDGVDFRVDATFAAGDVTVMKDEGAEANITTLPTDEGNGYSIPLSATEMQAARVVIYLVDQTATKVWLDKAIVIETYGNASAQHAFDLDTANVTLASATHTGAVIPTVTTLTNLPAITAGWLTAAGIAASALNGKGDWNIGKTGYSLTQAFPTNFADLSIAVTTGEIALPTIPTDWITSGGIASNAIGVSELAAGAIDSTILAADAITSSKIAAGAITAASIAASALDGKGDWNIGKTGYSLTVSDWATAANVATELANIHLDHLFAVDYDPATPPGVATAWANEIVESDTGVTRFTANALEQAPTGGSAPTVAQIADGVWDEVLSGHLTGGSTGEALNNAGSGASAATIADAVWDELQADHLIADSFGVLASEIATIDTVVDGIQTDLDNATDGLGAIKTAVDAKASQASVDTVDTVVDGIQTDLDNATDGLGAIKTAVDAKASQASVDTVDTVVDGIQTDLDNATDGLGAIKTAVDAKASQASVDTIDGIVDNLQLDTDDIQTRLPAVLVSGRIDANASAINDNSSAATKLAISADTMLVGTIDTASFTPTTTEFEVDDITEATGDHFIGRQLIGVTGTLTRQATEITDYVLTGGKGHFTVAAMTEAFANNDTFIIV